jgi:hypothetical protein
MRAICAAPIRYRVCDVLCEHVIERGVALTHARNTAMLCKQDIDLQRAGKACHTTADVTPTHDAQR